MHRFFLSTEVLQQGNPILKGAEAHHCLNVLRLRKGDRIVIFDGVGNEAMATIDSISQGTVELNFLVRSFTPRLPVEITLAQAIPKAKNIDWIIQQAVELGAACVAPLISERTVVQIKSAEQKQSKWEAIAIEACKQCKQNWLPRILSPTSLKTFLESVTQQDFLLIASLQPGARRLKEVLSEYCKEQGGLPTRVTIFVGPEGDFTPAEIALAKSKGCYPITLGPIVLRSETASHLPGGVVHIVPPPPSPRFSTATSEQLPQSSSSAEVASIPPPPAPPPLLYKPSLMMPPPGISPISSVPPQPAEIRKTISTEKTVPVFGEEFSVSEQSLKFSFSDRNTISEEDYLNERHARAKIQPIVVYLALGASLIALGFQVWMLLSN